MVLSLSACGSQEAMANPDNITTTEETTYTISTDSGTDTITDEISNEPTSLEETTEETSLEVSEPVVYEGIDMKSDLPVIEWLATFQGIIDKPQMIIANDLTNKKVIIANGSTVEFAMDDTLLFWFPDRELLSNISLDNDTFNKRSSSDSINWEEYLEFFPSQNWECNFTKSTNYRTYSLAGAILGYPIVKLFPLSK